MSSGNTCLIQTAISAAVRPLTSHSPGSSLAATSWLIRTGDKAGVLGNATFSVQPVSTSRRSRLHSWLLQVYVYSNLRGAGMAHTQAWRQVIN